MSTAEARVDDEQREEQPWPRRRRPFLVCGLPYMTAVVGGGRGSPKSRRQKEQNQVICDSDRGGGGKKI